MTGDSSCVANDKNSLAIATPHVPREVSERCQQIIVSGPLWVSQAYADSRAFAELAAVHLAPHSRVLDVGSGTGIFAISLALLGHDLVAVDLSAAAVNATRKNALRAGVEFPCYQSDLLDAVEGRYDLIAFNLPYSFSPDSILMSVAKNLMRRLRFIRSNSGTMPAAVMNFRRELTLRLLRQASAHLNPGGHVLLHVYESEAPGLIKDLSLTGDVRLLRHAGLGHQTIGMLVRPQNEQRLR